MQQFSAFLVTNWPLFLALVIIIAMLARSFFGAGATAAVRPAEALQLINRQDALVLDVRTDKEYQEGHILNAMHAPLGVLSSHLSQLAPYKQTPIVVVCRSGARSGQAVGVLAKAGFEQLHNLAGGIMAWQSANMPLTTEKGKPPKPAKADTSKSDDKKAVTDDSETVKTISADKKSGSGDAASSLEPQDAEFAEVTAESEAAMAESTEAAKTEVDRVDTEKTTPEIIIYTGGMCPYCARAIRLLNNKGVTYTELSVDGKPELRQEMTQKAGSSSVPQIFVDGTHIGDCDGIHDLDSQGRLDELLGLNNG